MRQRELSDFECDIAEIYEAGKIKAPIHLRNGNEDQLVKIFEEVKDDDYVFSTWANHLHALLKGVPPNLVRSEILAGNSITLHFPEYNFYSSAIVGGICPIATGIAWAIKEEFGNRKIDKRVYCFIGDMTLHSGIASESIRYSMGFDLPITWVVEDNGKSVGTPTEWTWNCNTQTIADNFHKSLFLKRTNAKLIYYKYETSYPHNGTGVFVEF